MPAVTKAQRRAVAIAQHEPGKLFKRNKSLMSMRPEDMHKFAATKEAGLPKKATRRTRKHE